MFNRRSGYCPSCDANVLHVRTFQSRIAYLLDKITLSFPGWFGVGPWECVNCGIRGMTLLNHEQYCGSEDQEPVDNIDPTLPVSNFIRTDHSLAHAVSDQCRYSEKFRFGIVEKLLGCKSTISRVCNELGISELEVQRWIRDYLQNEIDKVTGNQSGGLIARYRAGSKNVEQLDWDQEPSNLDGKVIESSVVRKPR